MKKTLNIILTVLTAAVFLSLLCYKGIDTLMPNAEIAQDSSELENRTYAKFPKISPSNLMKGKFQDGLEDYLSDHVPFRDQAGLLNAKVQRTAIRLSAATFGYEINPTYFESSYCEVPKDGVVIPLAEEVPKSDEKRRLNAWVSTLNDAVENHPDMRFVYDCVIRHDQCESNPTYELVTGDLVNEEWAREHILSGLDGRINAFTDAVESYDEIKSEWIPTEEHWTLRRAVKSYNKIADALGLEQYSCDDMAVVAENWFGDYCRSGLVLDYPYDLEDDISKDFSSISFYKLGDADGEPIDMGKRDSVLSGDYEFEPLGYHRYTRYFGSGSTEAVNSGSNNGKTALVICDSLSYPLKRYIASNYEHTVFVLPGNDRLKKSLESYIEQYHPNDVITVLHATKYRSIAGRSPAFVGLDKGGDVEE